MRTKKREACFGRSSDTMAEPTASVESMNPEVAQSSIPEKEEQRSVIQVSAMNESACIFEELSFSLISELPTLQRCEI